MQHLRSKATIFTLLAAASLCVTVAFFISMQRNVSATSPVIVPLSPESHSYATNSVTLSSKVDGLQPHEYEMFWATSGGEWNRMSTDRTTKISSATVDISGWNWRSDNTYTIRFIALIKSNWRSVEQSIVVNKGEAPLVAVQPSLPAISAPSPPMTLYVDSESVPAQKLAANPSNQALQAIATKPLAKWFGDWNTTVTADVDRYVTQATAANAIPTLVLYNIPNRDCGSYSAGGASSYSRYQAWGRHVADGIKNRHAIIIVEPDALADMDCLSSSERTRRTDAIAQIVTTLKTKSSRVYIDAGHSNWQSTSTMASRLKSSGIAKADGFSLNISNFRTTRESTAYGTTLASKVNNKHFIIDTSRNGAGPSINGEWCNPKESALGEQPTLITGNSLVDAYVWIKTPGESDGSCGSGAPAAGQWWQAYADMLHDNKK